MNTPEEDDLKINGLVIEKDLNIYIFKVKDIFLIYKRDDR